MTTDYTTQTWHDSPTNDTPINAARLTHIEEGLRDHTHDDVVRSVGAGSNISVDDTDPENPVLSTSSVQSVVAGSNISVDNTDPANPILSASGWKGSGYLGSLTSYANAPEVIFDDSGQHFSVTSEPVVKLAGATICQVIVSNPSVDPLNNVACQIRIVNTAGTVGHTAGVDTWNFTATIQGDNAIPGAKYNGFTHDEGGDITLDSDGNFKTTAGGVFVVRLSMWHF